MKRERDSEAESSDDFGPVMQTEESVPVAKKAKTRKLKFEKVFLDELPSSGLYEKSYMHRDVLTRVRRCHLSFRFPAFRPPPEFRNAHMKLRCESRNLIFLIVLGEFNASSMTVSSHLLIRFFFSLIEFPRLFFPSILLPTSCF